MQLSPYIFFYGKCEEALEFYKNVFGGTYELQRNNEGPPGMLENVAPDFATKVMHATFTGPGFSFMASDGRGPQEIDSEVGNISCTLRATDAAQGQQVFNALANGGKVKMPLEAAFWGEKFGILEDRFGIEWMIVSP